ncbi:MAG: STAS/SEC14 domain-containing protein [Planctomycetota bacterium]|jgi:hypothetical protein
MLDRDVFTEASGVLTDSDVIEFEKGLRDDPEFEPDFRQLADCRAIDEIGMTREGVEEASSRSPFSHGSRRALVVGSDVAFGMARMFENLRHEARDEIRVFREAEEARRWLGLEPTAP